MARGKDGEGLTAPPLTEEGHALGWELAPRFGFERAPRGPIADHDGGGPGAPAGAGPAASSSIRARATKRSWTPRARSPPPSRERPGRRARSRTSLP